MQRSLLAAAAVAVLALAACKTDDAAPGGSSGGASGKTCAGIAGLRCPEGQYCRMSGPLHPDKAGVCTPKPEMCNMLYQPVCGDDGKTYPNACHAARAGANVARNGACPEGK